jgi:hypothetical protein
MKSSYILIALLVVATAISSMMATFNKIIPNRKRIISEK